MTSLPSEEEPDSRTSSVGRKRGINQLTTLEDAGITIAEDSSVEEDQRQVKRPRYSEEGEVDAHRLNNTNNSSTGALIINETSEAAYSLEEWQSAVPLEDVSTDSSESVDAVNTIYPLPPTWNQGVAVAIRTSLTDIANQPELPLTQTSAITQTFFSGDVDTVVLSSGSPEATSIEQSLDDDDDDDDDDDGVMIDVLTNASGEGIGDANFKLERNGEQQQQHKYEQGHVEKMGSKMKTKFKSREQKGKNAVKQLQTNKNILAQLPSSFGPPVKQKQAEKIIKGLPEACKDLMPREVAGTALSYTDMGRTVKLPRTLHKDLPIVSLAKLSFCNPAHSFVSAFLKENQAILDQVDFQLLARAFQKYLKLLYGHLPGRLRDIVWTSRHVVGPRAEDGCLKLLEEAKKEVIRIGEKQAYQGVQVHLQETNRTGRAAMKAELRKPQNQTSEPRQALRAPRKSRGEVGEVNLLSGEADRRNAPTETQMSGISKQQHQSRTPGLELHGQLLTDMNGQSFEIGNKSPDSKTHLMGRLLGVKRAKSHAMHVLTNDIAINATEKGWDEKQLIRDQGPRSDNKLSIAGSLDRANVEQKLNTSSTNIELVRRYCPSSDGCLIVPCCLTCSQTSHETSECPSLTCANCGLYGIHFIEGCPRKQRCNKCHELGHHQSECPKKLAATADKILRCDICWSNTHLESACHFLWRSFKPGMPKTIKLVAEIPIHCYTCGAAGHFGSECGIRQSPLKTDGYSWSIINWKQYIDPQSHNRALTAVKDFSSPVSTSGKKSFSIKGSAQSESRLTSMDDENIPFIREKITEPMRPIPRGIQHIKFDQTRQDNDYLSLPQPDPPFTNSRNQQHRAAPQQKSFAEDRNDYSYRPRDDSARHMRERSFSPPPRFQEDRYLPRSGGEYYGIAESNDTYRPYNRDIRDFGFSGIASRARNNQTQRLPRGGAAQTGRGSVDASQGRRHRNRAG